MENKRKRDEGLSSFHVVVDLTKDEPVSEPELKRKRAKWWEADVCYIQPQKRQKE